MEVIGYIGRGISSKESPDWTLGPYIIQAILLLVAPVSLVYSSSSTMSLTRACLQALFAATVYMEFGRLVTRLDAERYTLIRCKWITKIFVTGDVLSFFLQGGGESRSNTLILLP